VDGDRDRLAQVVGNLYSNAIKYSPAGGVIRVELRPNGSEVVLAVEDEGMGIAPEDQERVFDKFFRSAEASAGIGGTALGPARARGCGRGRRAPGGRARRPLGAGRGLAVLDRPAGPRAGAGAGVRHLLEAPRRAAGRGDDALDRLGERLRQVAALAEAPPGRL